MAGLLGAMFPNVDGTSAWSTAPRTPFNGPLGPERAVVLAGCSLTDVKKVKTAFEVTVNDVVLAAVTSALRRELTACGALGAMGERPLVAAVPISVRPADLERGFGNHTSAMMVPLPTHIDDPIDVYKRQPLGWSRRCLGPQRGPVSGVQGRDPVAPRCV